MAARLNPRHQDMVRAKIQSAQFIKYLTEHIAGERKMVQTQVTAALGLLKKCIPDLQSTELTGDGGGPVQIGVVRFSDLPAKQLGPKALPDGSVVQTGTGMPPRGISPPQTRR